MEEDDAQRHLFLSVEDGRIRLTAARTRAELLSQLLATYGRAPAHVEAFWCAARLRDRLLGDIRYKRWFFGAAGIKDVPNGFAPTGARGVWTMGALATPVWARDVLAPWIRARLETYADDEGLHDHDPATYLRLDCWSDPGFALTSVVGAASNVRSGRLVRVTRLEKDASVFDVVEDTVDVEDDGTVVLSHDHVRALLFAYAETHPACFDPEPRVFAASSENNIVVTKWGTRVRSASLSMADVESIACRPFRDKPQLAAAIEASRPVEPASWEPASEQWYSSLTLDETEQQQQPASSATEADKSCGPDRLFRNALDGRVYALHDAPACLAEFRELGRVPHTKELTAAFIGMLRSSEPLDDVAASEVRAILDLVVAKK